MAGGLDDAAIQNPRQKTCFLDQQELDERKRRLADPNSKNLYYNCYPFPIEDNEMAIRKGDLLIRRRSHDVSAIDQHVPVTAGLNNIHLLLSLIESMDGDTFEERVQAALRHEYEFVGIARKDTEVDGFRDEPVALVGGITSVANWGTFDIGMGVTLMAAFPTTENMPRPIREGGVSKYKIQMILVPLSGKYFSTNKVLKSVHGVSRPQMLTQPWVPKSGESGPRTVGLMQRNNTLAIALTAIMMWEESGKFGAEDGNYNPKKVMRDLGLDGTRGLKRIKLDNGNSFDKLTKAAGSKELYPDKILTLAATGVPQKLSWSGNKLEVTRKLMNSGRDYEAAVKEQGAEMNDWVVGTSHSVKKAGDSVDVAMGRETTY
ncbi:MAG: hypothetical protein ACTSUE_05110 [Promethearchaeota archaeon]